MFILKQVSSFLDPKLAFFCALKIAIFLYGRNCISIACQPKFFHRATDQQLQRKPQEKIFTTKER